MAAITTPQELLDEVLSKLDANQLNLWQSIILRINGTVIEVNGFKYRKTNDLASSSKEINS